MIPLIDWTDRTWTFTLPVGAFPAVLERLRGAPARAAALAAEFPEEVLGRRVGDAWSAKEHLGHLDDLHALDLLRLEEFLSRVKVLSPADMKNRRTEEARHNHTPVAELVGRLAARRQALVARLESLSAEEVGVACLHPRLRQPMRLIDWAQFVAEHDDHHLARARAVAVRLQTDLKAV